jgi:hypothetical protein
VMGTTGGDREKLTEDVLKAGVYSVIAPQMGKQVGPLLMHFLLMNYFGCLMMDNVMDDGYHSSIVR